MARVEFHSGDLFPRLGFIGTNLKTDSRPVVRFYNRRGTAERRVTEGKQAVKMTRVSCHWFQSNEVRLGLPKKIHGWSLTSLQHRLVKTGGRLIKHSRYYWLLPAETHLTRRKFAVCCYG